MLVYYKCFSESSHSIPLHVWSDYYGFNWSVSCIKNIIYLLRCNTFATPLTNINVSVSIPFSTCLNVDVCWGSLFYIFNVQCHTLVKSIVLGRGWEQYPKSWNILALLSFQKEHKLKNFLFQFEYRVLANHLQYEYPFTSGFGGFKTPLY